MKMIRIHAVCNKTDEYMDFDIALNADGKPKKMRAYGFAHEEDGADYPFILDIAATGTDSVSRLNWGGYCTEVISSSLNIHDKTISVGVSFTRVDIENQKPKEYTYQITTVSEW